MKRFMCMICGCWLFVSAMAQISIHVATDKTTSLVFPFAIRHVDRGTQSVLAQQVKEIPTILLVKAAAKDFAETSLSVVTEDGNVYSFVVCYNSNPDKLVHTLPVHLKATVATYANAILDNPQSICGITDRKWKMLAGVKGIYIKGDIIFYQLFLMNQSPIDYDIDLLRFFISDKKKSKRTAVQQVELKPLYITGNTSQVKSYSRLVIAVALDKFTIPDAKFLGLQIMEKNGGRHLSLRISNRKIMQAITLPDLQ